MKIIKHTQFIAPNDYVFDYLIAELGLTYWVIGFSSAALGTPYANYNDAFLAYMEGKEKQKKAIRDIYGEPQIKTIL